MPGKQDVIVVFITSKSLSGKYRVPLRPSERTGLRVPSAIVCDKIATLDVQIVLGRMGVLSAEEKAALTTEVRTVLQL
jgi:mRNA-degrading endonuclease toxin of MazEF toxin-antitoxin module